MFRAIRTAGLVLALATLPAVAGAQDAKPLSFGVSGGLSLPMGDISDAYNAGFNVSGHVFYKLANQPKLTLRGDVTFDRFGGKDDGFSGLGAADFSFRSLGFLANAMYALGEGGEGKAAPYVIGGLGFYNGSANVDADIPGFGSIDIGGSSTDFGFNVGAGVNFGLAGFSAFAEARYHLVDGSGWIPVTFGIRF